MDQQQQQQLHPAVTAGIARLGDPQYREKRHVLIVDGRTNGPYDINVSPIDRQSLQHLVDFLVNRNREVIISELILARLNLMSASYPNPHDDGGLDVLRNFFSRSDTTPTRVTLYKCNVGSTQDERRVSASRLVAAFQTNQTVTYLAINDIEGLAGAALGNSLSGLLQNMSQLQRLEVSLSYLRLEGVRALQPTLQANRTLKSLNLYDCHIQDEGIVLLADALVGNTIIEVLAIGSNGITSNGLDDIARMIQSTHLKLLALGDNREIFSDADSTWRFARVLSRQGFLKDLHVAGCRLGDVGIHIIAEALVGNTIMEFLDIRHDHISSTGLLDLLWLIEATKLHKVDIDLNENIFYDEDATEHFITRLEPRGQVFKSCLGLTMNIPIEAVQRFIPASRTC